MIRRIVFAALTAALGAAALLASTDAQAITRTEVLVRAKTFSFHPWTFTAENLTASCSGAYQSVYVPGDYVGLAYDWGGYMTLLDFDQGLVNGLGAGSYPDDGVLSCTVGLDCSGFVSKSWDTGHYTTSSIPSVATSIEVGSMLAGDVFNDAGYHVAMLGHWLASGEPAFYEAYGYNVNHNVTGGWSHVDGYIPRRFGQIEGASAAEVDGTPIDPIVIGSLPYTDTRNTKESMSDLLDGCAAAPLKSEAGPEYIYEVTFDSPGTLTAAISDDATADIDIHLYTAMNTNDCVARHDTTITVDVDCGTYYIVADTFKGATESPGLYTLNVSFTKANKPCGNGPPQYSPSGKLGDACGNPNSPDLPFCNPNLGGDVCLYTDDTSFCTKPCVDNSDCGEFAGGCCGDIGGGEKYCFTSALCGGMDPPDEQDPPDGGGDPNQGDPTGGGAAGNAGSAGSGFGGEGGNPGAGASGVGASGNGGDGGSGNKNGADPQAQGGCNSGGLPAEGHGALLLALAALAARNRRRQAR